MKVTKRILAIVMTTLMALGTCAIAASAADSLQAAIDAASGGTVVMSKDTVESVVITQDLTLDLGGHKLTGTPGAPAITVVDANVTITNGRVYSQFAKVKSLDMVGMVRDESPAAIYVKGGSVSVEGVRAVGSCTRIPTTESNYFPTGSALDLRNGATATIKQSSLVGRYAVNSSVTGDATGGNVTIEDAILMGFMRAIKDTSKATVADYTEEVNAADRIEGFLNKPYKLEERERKVMKRLLDERIMIYTKSVSDDVYATFSTCTGKATLEAHEDTANIWTMSSNATDCSYKYVPEYVVLADGTLVKMTANDDTYTAEIDTDQLDDVKIKYRLEFDMMDDIERVATNFDSYLESFVEKAIQMANDVYDYALEKYTKYVELSGNILTKLDSMGNEIVADKAIKEYPQYNRLRRALYDLAGATAWNAVHDGYTFGDNQMAAIYGAGTTMPADGIVGTMDRVAKLKEELESFMPFSDQSKWADLGYWFYENYEEVLDIIDEAQVRVDALQNILDGDLESTVIQMAHLEDKRAMLDKVDGLIDDVDAALDRIMQSSTLQDMLQKADNHQSELKPYINKFIYIYNNHDKYFTPEKYVDGDFAKAYAVYGNIAESIDNTEHEFGDWVSDGDETHTRICTICGEETETVEHDLDTTITPPTCTEPGSITYTCEDCGYTKTVDGDPATDHSFGDWEYKDEDTHERFCENADCQEHEEEPHNYVEDPDASTPATCDAEGVITYVCDGCGDVKTETLEKSEDHTWDDGEYIEPDCTHAGYTLYTCTVCGTTYTEDGEPALGHDFENSEWIYSDEEQHMRTCDRCGDAFEFAAHDLDAVVTEPTCTEAGSTTYTCEDCGYTYTVDGDPETGHNFGNWEYKDDDNHERFCENANCQEHEEEAHNYVEDLDSSTPATCDSEGLIVYVCEGCGDVKTETLAKTEDHVWDAGEVTEPTCTEAGYITYTCTVCGETYTEDGEDALGHDFEPSEYLICDENQHMRICDRCGDEITFEDHHFTSETQTNDPTCTEEGSIITTYTCIECEYSYSETETIDALGHDWGEWEVTTDPTCTEPGEETRTCGRCPETETRPIDALGHDYEAVVTGPTCTEAGYTTYTCKNDSTHTYTEPGAPALGHDWSEWAVTKEATETEEGEETRTCNRCGETETRSIPKLGPKELTLTDSITNQTPANKISVKVPYSRRGQTAVTLIASEDDVTWTSSKPKLLTVDENGNVKFVRLCVFCRSATITATTPDGRTATCVVSIKLKWWQYIIYLLFGWLWF